MARIALATAGTAGDINPFIALGMGLRPRGHDVVFAVEARSSISVAAAGCPIHTLSGDIMAALGGQISAQQGSANLLKVLQDIVDGYLVPTIRPHVAELRAVCAGADLLIGSAARRSDRVPDCAAEGGPAAAQPVGAALRPPSQLPALRRGVIPRRTDVW